MKDETGSVAIEKSVGLKSKMYLFVEDDSTEHKKAIGVNKNVVARISHSKCKYVFLNNKSLWHSMNRIQSKNHKIEIYELNKISLSCFDDRRYILNNRYDELGFGY